MATEESEKLRVRDEGFRRNCVDSLAHALAHFSSIDYDHDRFHDRKWAILSVAHASEVFCNLLLSALDSRHPCGGRYPSLAPAIEQLREHTDFDRLSTGEKHVIREVFPLLPRQRNLLMHRPAPESLEISDAAVALLALLYLVRRRTGISATERSNQDPAIEADVLDELRVREQDRWFDLAEQLVLEDYGAENLQGCDRCGRFTFTPDFGCQACFAEH
jgi:hypothetical protein